MNNFLIAVCVSLAATSAMAQGQGRNGREGREQRSISVPENVFKSLMNDDKRADAVISDLKMLQSAGLPLDSYLELKLTPEQKKNISALVQSMAAQGRELMSNNDREGFMALRESMTSKVMALLTEDQKKTVQKYPVRGQQLGGGRDRGNRPGRPA